MAFGSVNVGQKTLDENEFINSALIGAANGIATLDADGKITASQRPDLYYTREESDSNISEAIAAHNADEQAHSDIRATISAIQTALTKLGVKFSTVTGNEFTVDFDTLDGSEVTGVWNQPQARIEF